MSLSAKFQAALAFRNCGVRGLSVLHCCYLRRAGQVWPKPSIALQQRSSRDFGKLSCKKHCKEAAVLMRATLERATVSTASSVVQQFYQCYNSGDVDGIMELMAKDGQYHDMIYSEPFRGHKEIQGFFDEVVSILPRDLKFVVDDITTGDPRFIGVKWHVDLASDEFPFSRGVSFYEVDKAGKIVYARDCVEPALKPGTLALRVLGLMAPIVRKLGPRANPGNLKLVPFRAIAVWALYAGYVAYVLLSSAAPGTPAYATPPAVLAGVFYESVNFFYINVFLQWAHLPALAAPATHPVSEALFNGVNAWSLMLLPLMMADQRGRGVKHKYRWWLGTMFLTNIFFIPYLAVREGAAHRQALADSSSSQDAEESSSRLPSLSNVVGLVAGCIGVVSVYWLVAGRPEFGGTAERWQWAAHEIGNNRVFYAFLLDIVLYSVWQALLMREAGAPKRLAYMPFAGAVVWLLAGGHKVKQQ